MALLPLCQASLGRKVLPVAFAVDASGGESGGNGGYGVVATVKEEMDIREELRWAERRGTYQRLSPGKIDGGRWKETLEATGCDVNEKQGVPRAIGFDRVPCTS